MAAILRQAVSLSGATLSIWESLELHVLLLSIYGCDALEVPVALAEVEGAKLGRALAVLVMFGDSKRS